MCSSDLNASLRAYNLATELGIAKEQARAILPEGLTSTRLYMQGTLRSWIHYIDVRAEAGTQKEHREIALTAQQEILKHFPSLEDYWFPKMEYSIERVEINTKTRPLIKPWWKFW